MRFERCPFQDGKIGLRINISDLDENTRNACQDKLVFHMSSYDFSKKPQENWDRVYSVVNRLLESLDEEKTKMLVDYMTSSKEKIDGFFVSKNELGLESLAAELAFRLDQLDQDIHLCQYIFDYITDHVPFGLTRDAGLHAQDSQEMTWYPEQSHVLLTIILLCKIVSPIFGQIAMYIDLYNLIPYREMICSQVLNMVLDRNYADIVAKLKYYISKIASRGPQESKSSFMLGLTTEKICFDVYTALLTRTYVNVDLMVDESNPITMTHVNIKKMIHTRMQPAIKNKTVKRSPPSMSSNEEDRIAQLEIDSLTSKKTADVVPLTRFAVADAIRRVKAKYEITDEDFERTYKYYTLNPVIPSIVNNRLNSVFYGSYIGGARGLLLLKADDYTKLTCLLQLILFSLDVGYYELAHMLTARPAVGISTCANRSIIEAQATTSTSYKNVYNIFESSPHGVRGKNWAKVVDSIVKDITTNRVIYNTANYIWDWLETDNLNGRGIEVTERTVDGFCRMYEFILELGV